MKRSLPRDWLTQTPIAHRGLHDTKHPENSLGAFTAAIEAGYAIEFDVHLTRDGVPVVIHDVDTARMTGQPFVIAKTDYSDLAELRLLKTTHHVATLGEVLRLVDGRVPILIEIKPNLIPLRIGPAVMKALTNYGGDYAVMSFDPRIMLWFRHSAPQVRRGLLSGHMRYPEAQNLSRFTRLFIRSMLSVVVVRPQFLAYDVTALPSATLHFWLDLFRLDLLFWTVQTESERRRARNNGGNIIFERIRP